MDLKIKRALEILGFEENAKVGKLPKMKAVKKKFHKLALTHHPDKPGGNGDVFKEMTEAYRLIGEYILDEPEDIEKTEDDDHDFEEEVARKTFRQFQFSNIKENMKSFTIHVENSQSFTWDKILTKHYGTPVDRETNGQHWKVENYTDGSVTANLTIGKWHIPKKDKQTKLHVQSSNETGNFLPAHFVDNVLPKLFEEVSTCYDLEIQGPRKEVSGKKETTLKPNIFKCKECDFVAKNGPGLNSHTRSTHKKVPKAQTKSKMEKDNSITVEEFATKYELKSNKEECTESDPIIDEKLKGSGETSSQETAVPKPIEVSKEDKQDDEVECNKPNQEESKKKVPKMRNSSFACKYCDKK